MNRLRINQLAFGLAAGVLGATSNRMGVWTQGCSLKKCPGCTSVHTWSASDGRVVDVRRLVDLAKAQPAPPRGLTISGGEPTDQAEAVLALVQQFRSAFPDSEVILYTGLRWSVVATRHPSLVASLDVVIAGPFARTAPAHALAGSRNQEVRLLTPLARSLYEKWEAWPSHRMQVSSDVEGAIVTIGIPHTPRLDHVSMALDASSVTWKIHRNNTKESFNE